MEIPQSTSPPHQSNGDGRYYIRMEREAKPAPHGIVQAMFFKRQKARLKISGDILKCKRENGCDFKLIVSNISQYPTNKVSFAIHFFNILDIPHNSSNSDFSVTNMGGNNFTINFFSEMVLWKGLDITSEFFLITRNEPFLYSIQAWSQDAEPVFTRGIFDPTTNQIIEKETNDTENFQGVSYFMEKLNSLKN